MAVAARAVPIVVAVTGTTANKKISVSKRLTVDVTRRVRRGGIFLGVPRSIVRRIDSRNDRKPREARRR